MVLHAVEIAQILLDAAFWLLHIPQFDENRNVVVLAMLVIGPREVFENLHELRFTTAVWALDEHDLVMGLQKDWNCFSDEARVLETLFLKSLLGILILLIVEMNIFLAVDVLDSIEHDSSQKLELFIVDFD